jgi:hypothetical protein
MSGNFNDGPLTALATVMQQHGASPPPQKAVGRTTFGSLLLVACGYTAFTLGPDALHQYPPAAMYGFFAVLGFGLLLFIVGVRGPRLPAEFMTKFWSLFWAAAFAAGSWAVATYLPDWWDNFFGRGFCLSFTIAQAIDFLLLLRPAGSDARTQVERDIAGNEFDWN